MYTHTHTHTYYTAYCSSQCGVFPFQILTHVDLMTGCIKYYTPRGRFIHIPPPCPRTDWANDFGKPWWKDNRYEVGLLSAKTRWIRIINTLTSQEQRLEVGQYMSIQYRVTAS